MLGRLGTANVALALAFAIGTLLRRFPGLRLAVPLEEIQWKTGLLVRGPIALPVSW